VIAVVALLLAVYCLIAAATALYAQPAAGHPDPEELAARERLIPVVFLAIVAFYAAVVARGAEVVAGIRRARPPRRIRLPSRRPRQIGAATRRRADDRLTEARSAAANVERFRRSTSGTTRPSTIIVSSPSSSMAWREDRAPGLGQLGDLRRYHENARRRGDPPDDEEWLGCERVLPERDLHRGEDLHDHECEPNPIEEIRPGMLPPNLSTPSTNKTTALAASRTPRPT
jgi:hypothetical protein